MEVIKLPWPGRSQGDSDFMQQEILDEAPKTRLRYEITKKGLGEKKRNSDEVQIFIR